MLGLKLNHVSKSGHWWLCSKLIRNQIWKSLLHYMGFNMECLTNSNPCYWLQSQFCCTLCYFFISWWRHQLEMFSALRAFCAGNSAVTNGFPGEFPAQRPVTWSFDVFFDLHLNKWLSKQWWGWCNVTPLSTIRMPMSPLKYSLL